MGEEGVGGRREEGVEMRVLKEEGGGDQVVRVRRGGAKKESVEETCGLEPRCSEVAQMHSVKRRSARLMGLEKQARERSKKGGGSELGMEDRGRRGRLVSRGGGGRERGRRKEEKECRAQGERRGSGKGSRGISVGPHSSGGGRERGDSRGRLGGERQGRGRERWVGSGEGEVGREGTETRCAGKYGTGFDGRGSGERGVVLC